MPVTTTFTLDRVTDLQLRDQGFVRAKLDEAVRAVADRDRELRQLEARTTTLNARTTELEGNLRVAGVELDQTKKSLADQINSNQLLIERVKQLETVAPKLAVEGLVSRFKADVDKINREVLAKPGEAGMLVDQVEVEIRGGIDMTNGVHITQLPPGALSAATASTLRFNLRPSTVVRIVDDEA